MSLETLKQQPEVSVEIITGNKAYERVRVFLGNLKKTFPNRGALVGLSRESFNENHETDPKLRRIHQNAPEHYYGKLGFVIGSTYGMGALTRRRKKESL